MVLVTCVMATPAGNQPQSSGLSSNMVLDAMDISDSEELSDHDSDSDVEYIGMVECEQEQGESNISGGETSTSTSSTSATSLLNVLRAPRPSDLARKRKLQCNPGKRKKTKTFSNFDPKGVKPQDHVRKYPNDCLSVSNGKACREELSLKSSSLTNYLKSQKHKEGKERLKRKEARDRNIANKLTDYNNDTHMVGESIAESSQIFRVKVVSAFLCAGIPLNKLEMFRELFEETGYRLTDRRNMHDLISFIHKQEFERIREEIGGKDVLVVFDGTTHIGEALVIVIRYVDPEWQITQRLVRLQMLVKSVTGEKLARELILVLSVNYGISTQLLLAAMKDRAAVNETAVRTLKVVYPNLLNIGCFSHAIDRVGEHFNTPNLSEFVTNWINLFSQVLKQSFCGLNRLESQWKLTVQLAGGVVER